MTTPRDAPASSPRRPRKPPRPVEVVSVSKIAPRLVSVTVAGPALEGFTIPAPTSHVKVFLPAPGQDAPQLPPGGTTPRTPRGMPDGKTDISDMPPERAPDGTAVLSEGVPQPVIRTYTPRAFDAGRQELELQFVLHGEGPASEWAERVKPGDKLAVAGPGGRFTLDETAGHWWIAADESAIPAVATLLEALPASAAADVHVEVADADDEITFDSQAKASVTWHHRRDPAAFGAELDAAARAADLPEGARIWVACEAAAMREIRRYFRSERGLPLSSLTTRGYWRLGNPNHPDHDYGDDDL